jgi:hypothetical protein
MIDLKLTDNDFSINASRSLELVSDSRLVFQKVYISLKLELGIYFYNEEVGVDWIYFIANSTPLEKIVLYLMKYLYEISGVEKVYGLIINFNKEREAVITGIVEDSFGQLIYFKD